MPFPPTEHGASCAAELRTFTHWGNVLCASAGRMTNRNQMNISFRSLSSPEQIGISIWVSIFVLLLIVWRTQLIDMYNQAILKTWIDDLLKLVILFGNFWILVELG